MITDYEYSKSVWYTQDNLKMFKQNLMKIYYAAQEL